MTTSTDQTSDTDAVSARRADKSKDKRGGARPGSGRKPRVPQEITLAATAAAENTLVEVGVTASEIAKQHISLVAAVTNARYRIGEKYPEVVDGLFTLMAGGEQTVRKYEQACLVLVDAYGEMDDKGRQAKIKVQAFPDHAPEELVLVSETVTIHPPDAAILQYLFNRLLGRPQEEKVNPLDESNEKKPIQSREEMFMDFMDMLFSRMEHREQQPHVETVLLA